MMIEKKFPKEPTEVLFCGLSFLQKWEVMLKDKDKSRLEAARSRLLSTLCNFSP